MANHIYLSRNITFNKPKHFITKSLLAVLGKMDFDLIGCLADFFREGVCGFLVLHRRSPFVVEIWGVIMLSWAVCLDIKFPFMFQRVVSCEKISEKVVCVHYNDNHYQISVDMIKPIDPPDFTYGEWVSPVNRPELVGFINDIVFHFVLLTDKLSNELQNISIASEISSQ